VVGSLTVTFLCRAETSGAETPVPKCSSAEKSKRRIGQRRDGGAQTVAPKWRRRNVTYRTLRTRKCRVPGTMATSRRFSGPKTLRTHKIRAEVSGHL